MMLPNKPQQWALFGADSLETLMSLALGLPAGSTVYGLDQSLPDLPRVSILGNGVTIRFVAFDFERDAIMLPPLDGILLSGILSRASHAREFLRRLQRCTGRVPFCIVIEKETVYRQLYELLMSAGYATISMLAAGKRTVILAEY